MRSDYLKRYLSRGRLFLSLFEQDFDDFWMDSDVENSVELYVFAINEEKQSLHDLGTFKWDSRLFVHYY